MAQSYPWKTQAQKVTYLHICGCGEIFLCAFLHLVLPCLEVLASPDLSFPLGYGEAASLGFGLGCAGITTPLTQQLGFGCLEIPVIGT